MDYFAILLFCLNFIIMLKKFFYITFFPIIIHTSTPPFLSDKQTQEPIDQSIGTNSTDYSLFSHPLVRYTEQLSIQQMSLRNISKFQAIYLEHIKKIPNIHDPNLDKEEKQKQQIAAVPFVYSLQLLLEKTLQVCDIFILSRSYLATYTPLLDPNRSKDLPIPRVPIPQNYFLQQCYPQRDPDLFEQEEDSELLANWKKHMRDRENKKIMQTVLYHQEKDTIMLEDINPNTPLLKKRFLEKYKLLKKISDYNNDHYHDDESNYYHHDDCIILLNFEHSVLTNVPYILHIILSLTKQDDKFQA